MYVGFGGDPNADHVCIVPEEECAYARDLAGSLFLAEQNYTCFKTFRNDDGGLSVTLMTLSHTFLLNKHLILFCRAYPPETQNGILRTPGDALCETLLVVKAVKSLRSSRITLVVPYFPSLGQKIALSLVSCADLLIETLRFYGVEKIISVDTNPSRSGDTFFRGFKEVSADNTFYQYLSRNTELLQEREKYAVVSFEDGSEGVCESFAEHCRIKVLRVRKKIILQGEHLFSDPGVTRFIIRGFVAGSCEVLCEMAEVLRGYGAESVDACITHATFSGNAVEDIERSSLRKVYVSNTVPLPANIESEKIVQVDCKGLVREYLCAAGVL